MQLQDGVAKLLNTLYIVQSCHEDSGNRTIDYDRSLTLGATRSSHMISNEQLSKAGT